MTKKKTKKKTLCLVCFFKLLSIQAREAVVVVVGGWGTYILPVGHAKKWTCDLMVWEGRSVEVQFHQATAVSREQAGSK